MKKSLKWIIIAVLFVGLIVGASVLYNNLSEKYSAEDLITTAEPQSEADEENDFAAPDFTVLDSEGNEVKLSDFKGKPVVINFWTTWCYYCKEEMPSFDKASENHPDVQFMMINASDGVNDTVEAAKQFVEQNGYGFDIFFDTESQALSAYYISGFPATFFVDKDGNLATYRNGMVSEEMLEQGISMIAE